MKLIKFLALALSLLGVVSGAGAASRPNILFVFIDDLGWADLSCYGSTVTNKQGQPITPNLDRLASQGVRFTQGYVASPICSPSRTGVLTGMEPARFAIYSFLNDKASNASRNMPDWLQPDTVTAPRLFQKAGYATGQFGKWHMGNGRDVNNAPVPGAYGFDESLVAFEGNGNRLLYYENNGAKYGLSQQNEDASQGTYRYVYFYEAAREHTSAALTFMTNAVQAGKPFYMHVPYNDTHSPYNVTPGQENDFDHIVSDTTAKTFLTELHNLDKQVGRLMAAVDGLGIATNTLIVAVGDNGAPNDSIETLLNRNGGLRGGKGNLYEGGIRETFIARWAGTIPAGTVNSTTAISTLDLLPTYCAFAGIPLPNAPFAGEDMSDVLRGSARQRIKPLFWEYGTVSGLNPSSPRLAIRLGDYKFLRNPDGTGRALYQIPQDHAEGNNLVGQPAYAAQVSALESQLVTWYNEAVLGEVGETYTCGTNDFSGPVLSDNYNVTSGSSPGSGFGVNSGVNFQFASRTAGAVAPQLLGYRLGTTGGTSPRQPSDFGILDNSLTAAPRNGNGRFEFTTNGTTAFDFGPWLAGRTYELSVQLGIDFVGPNYSQRLSLGLSDVSDAAVGDVDLGIQIGTDGAGGLGVFKRIAAGSASSGTAVNSRMVSGLPIGFPVDLKMKVIDYSADTTAFNSSYEIWLDNILLSTGSFRFNNSAARYLVFDVAAHEGFVHYDNLALTVLAGNVMTNICRKPVLSISEVTMNGAQNGRMRLYWSAQPGMTVQPEFSSNLLSWQPATNSAGIPHVITTEHGTFQWLEIPPLPVQDRNWFFRLRRF